MMPVGIRPMPITSTTTPATSGGKRWRILVKTEPKRICTTPAKSAPPKTAARPNSWASGIDTTRNPKLVPCTMGSRAPIGPSPTVWMRVAMPATSSAICTRNAVSSAEEPIALARITGIVTLLAIITMTCWRPSGTAVRSGGRSSTP
jgi:hypothetical protein